MKYLLMVVLLFSFNQAIAAEVYAFIDGNDLLETCEAYLSDTDNAEKGNQCFGYIQGLEDAQTLFVSSKHMKAIWCIPKKNITATQLVRVVTKYLQEHPEELHLSGASTAGVALIDAFPCE